MTILVLNGARSAGVPYGAWLRELGEDIVLLCAKRPPTDADLYRRVVTFDDYEHNGNVERVALQLHAEQPFRRIIAKAEADLVRAAKLREILGIEGQSLESALAYRDKTVMKELTARAGVRTPRFRRVCDALDLLSFVREVGLPVFVKPVDGSGARGAAALRTPEALETFLAAGVASNLIVEELIEGDVYHVDGIVLDGAIQVMRPSRYTNGGCLAFQSDKSCGSIMLARDNPLRARLEAFVARVIEVLPSPRELTFHAEVFHTPKDELVFCEIASRTGGVRINEAVRLATDVDLDRVWIRAQCGLREDLRAADDRLCGWLVVPPRSAILEAMPTAAPAWIRELRPNASVGDDFSGRYAERKAGDYVASIIVSGQTELEVADRLGEASRWLETQIVWGRP